MATQFFTREKGRTTLIDPLTGETRTFAESEETYNKLQDTRRRKAQAKLRGALTQVGIKPTIDVMKELQGIEDEPTQSQIDKTLDAYTKDQKITSGQARSGIQRALEGKPLGQTLSSGVQKYLSTPSPKSSVEKKKTTADKLREKATGISTAFDITKFQKEDPETGETTTDLQSALNSALNLLKGKQKTEEDILMLESMASTEEAREKTDEELRREFFGSDEAKAIEEKRSLLEEEYKAARETQRVINNERMSREKDKARRQAQLVRARVGGLEGDISNVAFAEGVVAEGADYLRRLERDQNMSLNSMERTYKEEKFNLDEAERRSVENYIKERRAEIGEKKDDAIKYINTLISSKAIDNVSDQALRELEKQAGMPSGIVLAMKEQAKQVEEAQKEAQKMKDATSILNLQKAQIELQKLQKEAEKGDTPEITAAQSDFLFYSQLKKTNPEMAEKFAQQRGFTTEEIDTKLDEAIRRYNILIDMKEKGATEEEINTFSRLIGLKPEDVKMAQLEAEEKRRELEGVRGVTTTMTRPRNTGNVANDLNNPANLVAGGVGDQFAIGSTQVTGKDGVTRNFLVFQNVEDGYKAMAADLKAKFEGRSSRIKPTDTLGRLTDVWVGGEGAGKGYKSVVSKQLGVGLNTPISQLDPMQTARALAKAEGFTGGAEIQPEVEDIKIESYRGLTIPQQEYFRFVESGKLPETVNTKDLNEVEAFKNKAEQFRQNFRNKTKEFDNYYDVFTTNLSVGAGFSDQDREFKLAALRDAMIKKDAFEVKRIVRNAVLGDNNDYDDLSVLVDRINNIQNALKKTKTGFVRGNFESAAQAIGETTDPELAQAKQDLELLGTDFTLFAAGTSFTEGLNNRLQNIAGNVNQSNELLNIKLDRLKNRFVNERDIPLKRKLGADKFEELFGEKSIKELKTLKAEKTRENYANELESLEGAFSPEEDAQITDHWNK